MGAKEIIICWGIPGSGKTTFAKKWVEEDPENRFRFNNDELLKMMTDGVYTKESYYIIREMQQGFLNGILSNYKSCILDNTHMNPSVLENLLLFLIHEIDPKYNYDIIIKDFVSNITIEECIKRDAMRDKPVGENVIRKMYDNIDKVKATIDKFEKYKDIRSIRIEVV